MKTGGYRMYYKYLSLILALAVMLPEFSYAQKTPLITTPFIDLGRDEVSRNKYRQIKTTADTVASDTKSLETNVTARQREIEESMLCGQHGMLRVPAGGQIKNWKATQQVAGTTVTQALCSPMKMDTDDATTPLADIDTDSEFDTDVGNIANIAASGEHLIVCGSSGYQIFKYSGSTWTPLTAGGSTMVNLAGTNKDCTISGDVGIVIKGGSMGFYFATIAGNSLSVGGVHLPDPMAGMSMWSTVPGVSIDGDTIGINTRLIFGHYPYAMRVYKRTGPTTFSMLRDAPISNQPNDRIYAVSGGLALPYTLGPTSSILFQDTVDGTGTQTEITSMSGTGLKIGQYMAHGNGFLVATDAETGAGQLRIYQYKGGTYIEKTAIKAPSGITGFGQHPIDMDNNTLVAAHPDNLIAYRFNGINWVEQRRVQGTAYDDVIAVSGNTMFSASKTDSKVKIYALKE